MGEIKIGRAVLGAIQTNCYFLFREGSSEAIVFDPADSGMEIYKALKEQGLEVVAICLTHGHFDHILGVAKLRQMSHCKLYSSEEERELLGNTHLNQSDNFGYECTATPDETFSDGDEITLAGINIKVILTPGHTSGSCCYYVQEAGLLISGDTLFEGSVGRSDFPTGSASTLVASIKEKLLDLPDNTMVYPGHGNTTTIGEEKMYNPFIA